MEPVSNVLVALERTEPWNFVVHRTEWPAVEIDTSEIGMIALIRSYSNWSCQYQGYHLSLWPGSLIVIPGTDMAVLLWNHQETVSYSGFTLIDGTQFGYYEIPYDGRLDHPNSCSHHVGDLLFVVPGRLGAH